MVRLLRVVVLVATFLLAPAALLTAEERAEAAAVRIERGIVFGKGGEQDLRLDLYRPPAKFAGPRPGIVWIHGGGWRAGSREAMEPFAIELARAGFVGASVDYRLLPKDPFPAAVEDVKCAVRWMRAKAKEIGVDPDRIAAAGTSAGGHLALMAGLADERAGLEGKGRHDGVSSRVQAVVSGFGPADLRGAVGSRPATAFAAGQETAASPVTHASADDPPVLLLHGTEDTTVPYAQSEKMVAALEAVGGRATLIPARGAGHGYWRDPRRRVDVLATIEVWLERNLPAR
jgi:acetyl esterase/lipase